MLTLLDVGPENVLAMRVEDTLSEADVTRLTEELDYAIDRHGRIRVYWEVGAKLGITPKGLWQDLRYGLRNFRKVTKGVERVAVVADQRWLRALADLEGRIFPAMEERSFTHDEQEEALRWILKPEPTH